MTMRRGQKLVAAVLAMLVLPTGPAFAAESAPPSAAALAAVVQQHGAQVEADRTTIRSALAQREVRDTARKVGIDVDHLAAALGAMPPSDVARAAAAAERVNQRLQTGHQFVGGDRIVISSTALIIALLVVLLLVVSIR
jgi:hypothetical protein